MKRAPAFLFFAACLASLLFPFAASAHPENIYIENTIGPYLVDLEADTFVLEAGTPSTLTISLFDSKTLNVPDFDTLKISILHQGKEIASASLPKDQYVPESFPYTFAKNDSYDVRLRYLKGGKDIVDTDFPILVGTDMFPNAPMNPAQAQYPSVQGFSLEEYAMIILIIAAICAVPIIRSRKKKQ